MKTLLSNPPTRISRVTGWHKERWIASVSNLLSSEVGGLKVGWEDLRPENLTPKIGFLLQKTCFSLTNQTPNIY